MEDLDSYAAYAPKAEPNDEWRRRLDQTVVKLKRTEEGIERAEQALKDLKALKSNITDAILPALLKEMGQERAGMTDGTSLVLSTRIEATLAADKNPKREQALVWLEANGGGDLVKNQVVAELDKGEADKAQEVEALLQEHFPGLFLKRRREAHTGAVQAHLAQMRADGKTVPFELFNGHERNYVKVTWPKEPK